MKTLFVAFMLTLSMQLSARESNAKIYYNTPAARWHAAIPLGNGRIGAMVYGGVFEEHIAMNEVTMWSGSLNTAANDVCGPEMLARIRKAVFADNYALADSLAWHHLVADRKAAGTHLPFGDIVIKSTDRVGRVFGYRRQLDMSQALANVEYTVDGKQYSREYFCSNPAQAFVARYTARKGGRINVVVGVDMLRNSNVKAEGNKIIVDGNCLFDLHGIGGVDFRGVISVKTDGGNVAAEGDKIVVSDARAMTLVCDIRTNYADKDFIQLCNHTVATALSMSYKQLRKSHVEDYSPLFSRMSLTLSPSVGAVSTALPPMEDLLKDARAGKSNPLFDEIFFNYGRYMLISSSRENSPLPANLQGIWNDNLACNMGWTCDYHLDINIQQNYWSANIANMPECNAPLFSYIADLAKHGSETARVMYGCRGWVAHTMNDVWGNTMPGKGLAWATNVTAGAWIATHLWTHFQYTQDIDYLRQTGYPLLKKTAEFFIDYMVEDPRTGYLVTGPSISPETAFSLDGKTPYFVSMMPTIDRGVVYDIYDACIQASRLLDVDADMRSRLERDILRLPPLRVGSDGALMEWQVDGHRTNQAHRHASHLVTLYPFSQISPERTPQLAAACDKFLELQTKCGWWEDTEWTRGNMINFYARLKNPEETYRSLMGMYERFVSDNLMSVSPQGVAGAQSDIFSFDGNEAAVSGICEALLQSYDGYLDFLPALPKEWSSGSVRGICARGGIEADITWADGKVTAYQLRSKEPQTVTCRINGEVKQVACSIKK